MITIINEQSGYQLKLDSYKKLYYHIAHQQRSKRHDEPQLLDEWIFTCHSHRRIMAFYEFVTIQRMKAEQEQIRRIPRFDVLEICCDPSLKPIIFAITPDLDIESHLKDWCRLYCQSHGYKLVEVSEDDGMLHTTKYSPRSSTTEEIYSWKDRGDQSSE
jgi:hypothetical protein